MACLQKGLLLIYGTTEEEQKAELTQLIRPVRQQAFCQVLPIEDL
jgi:hypothetical protein